jgi:hypothetical protein
MQRLRCFSASAELTENHPWKTTPYFDRAAPGQERSCRPGRRTARRARTSADCRFRTAIYERLARAANAASILSIAGACRSGCAAAGSRSRMSGLRKRASPALYRALFPVPPSEPGRRRRVSGTRRRGVFPRLPAERRDSLSATDRAMSGRQDRNAADERMMRLRVPSSENEPG